MQILIILTYLSFYLEGFQFFEIFGYGVTTLNILLVIFIFYYFKKAMWDGIPLKLSWNPAVFFLLFLVAAIIISGLSPIFVGNQNHIVQYFKTTSHLFFLMFFPFMIASTENSHKIWSNVIKMLLILSILINMFGIYQIIARAFSLPFAWIDYTNISLSVRGSLAEDELYQLSLGFGSFFRATSIFSEPSALAAFNLFILVYILTPYIHRTKSFFKSKFLNIFILFWSLAALFATFSLTAFSGLIVLLLAYLIFEFRQTIKRIWIMLTVGIIILLAVNETIYYYSSTSVSQLFYKRISGILLGGGSTEGESFYTRSGNGKITIDIWQKSPLIGVGAGLLQHNNNHIVYSDFASLAALAETGILGFIGFFGIIVSLIFIALRYLINLKDYDFPDNLKTFIPIQFYYVLLLMFFNTFTSNNFATVGFWIPIAIFFGISSCIQMSRKENIYTIKLVKEPIKQSLYKYVSYYLKKRRLIQNN